MVSQVRRRNTHRTRRSRRDNQGQLLQQLQPRFQPRICHYADRKFCPSKPVNILDRCFRSACSGNSLDGRRICRIGRLAGGVMGNVGTSLVCLRDKIDTLCIYAILYGRELAFMVGFKYAKLQQYISCPVVVTATDKSTYGVQTPRTQRLEVHC